MKFRGLFAAAIFSVSVPSFATLTQVSARNQLSPDDYLDWSSLGAVNDPIADGTLGFTNLLNQFQVTSDGSMELRDQGNGWGGNFSPGDHLLYNMPDSTTLGLVFNQGVEGLGFQIEGDSYGPFTAEMDVYNLNLDFVNSFFVSGDSEDTSDGSAPFLGVQSDSQDIGGIVLTLSAHEDFTSFAVNQVTISNSGPVNPVPEPATMAILGAGALALLRRRRNG